MNQYFLRFADAEEAKTELSFLGVNDDGEIVTQSDSHALDVIGAIAELVPTGELDDDGNPGYLVTEFTGYHVNLLIDALPDSLTPYAVTPAVPHRVFAI